MENKRFWTALEELVSSSEIIIDRPKGSRHPRDSEIKILIGCTEEEKRVIYDLHNENEFMKGIMIRRG